MPLHLLPGCKRKKMNYEKMLRQAEELAKIRVTCFNAGWPERRMVGWMND